MGERSLHRTDEGRAALIDLLAALEARDYRFTTITPASHAHVVARTYRSVGHDLRDIFGWSLPFPADALDGEITDLMARAGVLERHADLYKSAVRASRVCGRLFLHSAYPTEAEDAVFLGPDTYRFVRFARAALDGAKAGTLVDIGAGAGVGGILAGLWTGARVILSDINAGALFLAGINAEHAGIACELVEASGLPDSGETYDLIIANPPFIMDPKGREYRDGGDLHGAGLSRDWAFEAAGRLTPGGRFLLYTGSAIVAGEDELRAVIEEELPKRGCTLEYEEIDPDIFGEELALPSYAEVDRIAAIGAVVTRAG
jgi:methylase of polypeptide subunit release factors